jgi:hypothetical protein
MAAPGTAARPGDPGSARQRFRRRGIAARVTVERRRLPDRGSQRTRPRARIPACTRSTRPGVPARPVLAVERACAPRGERCRAARADGRVRPGGIRARVLAAGRERPVSRRYGHPDVGGTRRRPTGGRVDCGPRRSPGPFRAGRERGPRGRRRSSDRAKRVLRSGRWAWDITRTPGTRACCSWTGGTGSRGRFRRADRLLRRAGIPPRR